MTLTSKAHYDLMTQFESEFSHHRLDKEDKSYWAKGNIYQNGTANELFLAYRRGYAFGMAVA
jgi:hypothetical protein